MADHKVIIAQPSRPPTAQEAAKAIYGVSLDKLVRAILNNKDGQYDKLYDVKGKLYGKIRTDDVTLIIKSVFEAALMENGYSPEPVYKWLRANLG